MKDDAIFFRMDSKLKAEFLDVAGRNGHSYTYLFDRWIKTYIKKFSNTKKNDVDKIAERV